MTSLMSKLGGLVGASGAAVPYRHVSETMAKALAKSHPYSTRRWPHDNGDGQFERGSVFCQDAEFFIKERSLHQPAYTLASADEILMTEWPTQARLRSIRYKRTVAAAADNPGVANNTQLNYLDASTNPGAFPTFTIIAKDPADASFTPIVLGDVSTNTEGAIYLAPNWAYGINRRKVPLLISIKIGGVVPADSGVMLWCDFVGQHL